jgi:SAM-dependent methyltransferase
MSHRRDIRDHYDRQERQTLEQRRKDPNIAIRSLMNDAKTKLISQSTRARDVVLDLGCGNGGDINKFAVCGVAQYDGYDISKSSVEEANRRCVTVQTRQECKLNVAVGDFTDRSFWSSFRSRTYHVINSQMSFHYAWENFKDARRMVEEIARILKPGGYWIGSCLNADAIRALVKQGHTFRNKVFEIERSRSHENEYRVTVGDRIKQCREWMVNLDAFLNLCKDNHLRLKIIPFDELQSTRHLSADEREYTNLIVFFQVYRPLETGRTKRRDRESDHRKDHPNSHYEFKSNDHPNSHYESKSNNHPNSHYESKSNNHSRKRQKVNDSRQPIRGPAPRYPTLTHPADSHQHPLVLPLQHPAEPEWYMNPDSFIQNHNPPMLQPVSRSSDLVDTTEVQEDAILWN